ncbi:MAG: hypothetical protein K2O89_05345 [Clostridia bacterium]|nr:hypothetical protein [Clostridia bacterium]
MKNKTIKTKQDFYWHFVDTYIDLISHIHCIGEDEIFRDKLCDLKNYINEKLQLASDGEIIETYVTVLQQSDE